ncbi:unnamed protein product [Adineta ricciae]|nr:unnamed protein product [Adineta ricciae]
MDADNAKEQIQSLSRELDLMHERYSILADVHSQLQKDNSLLEERILTLVETYSNEKNQLEQELINAKEKIFHLEDTMNDLEIEKQRYKDDCNLAVRLLHRHPNEYVSTSVPEHTHEQSKTKAEATSTNHSVQSQHSVMIPTFPPMFVTPLPLLNTMTSPSPVTSQVPSTSISDNLRLAESLFKTNNVHRYPSKHFICSKCYQTVKCCDVSVQTSLDDHNRASRNHRMSLSVFDDELDPDPVRTSSELHHHLMTVQEYQMGNTRRSSQDLSSQSSNSIPQMHHV